MTRVSEYLGGEMVPMDYRDLGFRVRDARRKSGLTQEKLAEKVGISPSFLGHIERGTRVASLETLVALCNELSVSPDYLLSASLHPFDRSMPSGLTEAEKIRLSEFLRLAQDTVRNWK